MKTRFSAIAAALALLAAGCSQDDASPLEPNASGDPAQSADAGRPALPLPVWFFGTVHRIPDNGGAWIIRTAGGTQYQPTELPAEFQVDGLAVEVEARKHDVVMSKDVPGQAIDIVRMNRRGSPRRENPPEPRETPPSGG